MTKIEIALQILSLAVDDETLYKEAVHVLSEALKENTNG